MKKLYKIVFYVQPWPDEGENKDDHFKSEWKQVVVEFVPSESAHRAEVILAVAHVIARHVSDQIDASVRQRQEDNLK
jgi:hypothetical protein